MPSGATLIVGIEFARVFGTLRQEIGAIIVVTKQSRAAIRNPLFKSTGCEKHRLTPATGMGDGPAHRPSEEDPGALAHPVIVLELLTATATPTNLFNAPLKKYFSIHPGVV